MSFGWKKRSLVGLAVVMVVVGSFGGFRLFNPTIENNISVNMLGIVGPDSRLEASAAIIPYGGIVTHEGNSFNTYSGWFTFVSSLAESRDIMKKIQADHQEWIVVEDPVNVLAVEPTP